MKKILILAVFAFLSINCQDTCIMGEDSYSSNYYSVSCQKDKLLCQSVRRVKLSSEDSPWEALLSMGAEVAGAYSGGGSSTPKPKALIEENQKVNTTEGNSTTKGFLKRGKDEVAHTTLTEETNKGKIGLAAIATVVSLAPTIYSGITSLIPENQYLTSIQCGNRINDFADNLFYPSCRIFIKDDDKYYKNDVSFEIHPDTNLDIKLESDIEKGVKRLFISGYCTGCVFQFKNIEDGRVIILKHIKIADNEPVVSREMLNAMQKAKITHFSVNCPKFSLDNYPVVPVKAFCSDNQPNCPEIRVWLNKYLEVGGLLEA